MTTIHHDAPPAADWAAIEQLPEFRELVGGRRRFAWIAGALGIGVGALYVVLAATAHDLMGTHLAGSLSLGFAGGVGLVLLTWAITLAYMRRSRRVWAPLEARIRALVAEGSVAPSAAPAPASENGRFRRAAEAEPTTEALR
jgi:uncharacterized membrane protein (DUF485 family)